MILAKKNLLKLFDGMNLNDQVRIHFVYLLS
jgi:hypothetical protein